IQPDHIEALAKMGQVRAQQRRLDEAVDYFNAALRLDPTKAHAYDDLGNALFSLGRKAEAIRAFSQAVKFQADEVKFYIDLGHALRDQGQPEASKEVFRQSLELDPSWPGKRNQAAWMLATYSDRH